MDKETLREIFLSLSSKDVRIAKYAALQHTCNEHGMLQMCSSCNLQLCSMCYVKHITEKHPSAKHFMEKISGAGLLPYITPQRAKLPIVPKRNEEKEASHASKRTKKTSRGTTCLSPTNYLDFLNGEELTKLLEKVREHQIAQ